MSSPTAQMDGPGLRVIEPKLMPPRVHPGVLRRARLLEMLDDDAGASLTVLNAAVGYGKTTLVRSWCVERPEAVIWVTLDSADDDPVRLWSHLATGVERLGEGFGGRALSCLAVRGATVETAVDELMNGLVAYGRRVTIVLDDLHAVRSEASVRSIAQAIERLPANARLVASTRSDRAIGVARLRARRALTEVRARELAFRSTRRVSLWCVRGSACPATASICSSIERRDGLLVSIWPRCGFAIFRTPTVECGSSRAALARLANIFGRGSDGARARGQALPGVHLGAGALHARVMRRGPRARGLGGGARGPRTLEYVPGLARRPRGVVSLPPSVRRGSAAGAREEAARELRRRAAAWCRAQGLVEEAIEYAAVAGDAEVVAELLIERHLEFIWDGRLGQLLGRVPWLPAELLVTSVLPVSAAAAAAMLAAPDVEGQRFLAVTERARRERPQLWVPYLEAGVQIVRADVIQRGEVGAAVGRGRRAVAAAQEGADVLSASALACLAQAQIAAWRARRDAPGGGSGGRSDPTRRRTRRLRRMPRAAGAGPRRAGTD